MNPAPVTFFGRLVCTESGPGVCRACPGAAVEPRSHRPPYTNSGRTQAAAAGRRACLLFQRGAGAGPVDRAAAGGQAATPAVTRLTGDGLGMDEADGEPTEARQRAEEKDVRAASRTRSCFLPADAEQGSGGGSRHKQYIPQQVNVKNIGQLENTGGNFN